MRKIIFVCFILTCLVVHCPAQDKGDYALTLGFNYNDRARKQPTFQDKESVPSKLEFWLLSNFSVRVQSSLLLSNNPFPVGKRVTGRGDTVAGAYLNLVDYDADHPLGVSLDYQLKFPSAVKGLGTDQFDHQVLGIIYRNFGKRVYGEFDGGAAINGQQGKSAAGVPLFSFIEQVGLVYRKNDTKHFKWSIYNETDYSPPAAGGPTSVTAVDELIFAPSKTWSFKAGPTYAFTPYDSPVGFAFGLTFNGHLGK